MMRHCRDPARYRVHNPAVVFDGRRRLGDFLVSLPAAFGGRTQIRRRGVQLWLRRGRAGRGDNYAVVGPVIDEPVGRIYAAEVPALAEADTDSGPVVVIGHVDHRDVAGNAATHARTPPVGVVDLDFPGVDDRGDHCDV